MSKEITVMQEESTMFEKAQWMIDKKVVPSGIKKVEDVVTIVNKGQQLGMDPLTALNSMHLIQGNVAIKSSVIPGLLAKAGIGVELVKDMEPVMKRIPVYIKGDDDKPLPPDEDGNYKYIKDPEGNVQYKDVHVKVDGHLEYVTTIRFHRFYPEMNKTIESEYSFYWSDCVSAEWHKKSNWKKLPRFMMYARCVVRGARGVASDVIGGLYDTHEVIEFSKVDYEIDSNKDAIPITQTFE